MSTDTPLARWLKTEMPKRGYAIGSPRSGGISRLAQDADIPQATVSRLVNGAGEPSVDNLRKLGRVFGVSLAEMMVHAGQADAAEMSRVIVGPIDSPTDTAARAIDLPPEVDLDALRPWERHIWLTPNLDAHERRLAVLVVRLARGDLHDINALHDLQDAVDEIRRKIRAKNNPGQAS